MELIKHEHDVLVVGAGGSGLRASMGLSQSDLSVACISKVFPTEVILLQLKVVLVELLATWVKMIGDGICMTPLKALTG